MAHENWFLTLVVAAVAVNGGFFVLAYSQPVHEEWLFYMSLDVPPAMASSNSLDDVQPRLEAAGYHVTRETVFGEDRLAAAKPSEHDYRVWIGRGPWASRVQLDLQCRTGYFRDDCPTQTEPAMRARFAQLLQESGLALDANDAQWGDYDFATLGEFFLVVIQLFIAFISVVVLCVAGAMYIGLRRRGRRALPQPYTTWSGPVAYGAAPPYPPPLPTQAQEHRERQEFEPVGAQRGRPEQPQ